MKLSESKTCHKRIKTVSRVGVGVGESFRNSLESWLIDGARRCGFLATAGRPTFVAEIRQRRCDLGYMDRGGYYPLSCSCSVHVQ